MAVSLEDAVAEARLFMGSVSRSVSDWGDRWVFSTANKYQFGAGTAIIDKVTGKNLGSLSLRSEDNNRPETVTHFDLPEGLYDKPFGDEFLPKNWTP